MKKYQRAGVASTFSPTFLPLLAEAECLARHLELEWEVLHASDHDEEKEIRFREAMTGFERKAEVRWLGATDSPAGLLSEAVERNGYDLLIAGALASETSERPFSSGVARALMRRITSDLLLVPNPSDQPEPPRHVVFALEPGEDAEDLLQESLKRFRPEQVTLATLQSPFADALAATRGEEPADNQAWLNGLAEIAARHHAEAGTMLVPSNTGFILCEAIQALNAGLLIVRADAQTKALPVHMDWLYQVIPTRLLVVRND